MKRKKRPSPLESAARGAIAGLVGGGALVLAHRSVLPRLPDRKKPRVDPWDKQVASLAGRVGWAMTPRSRMATGVAAQIAASVILGAAYTLIVEQLEPPKHAEQLLDAGLVFAASLIAPELERTRKPRGRRRQLQRKALERINGPKVFGKATTVTLKALARYSARYSA
ncbi:MAG TPA: hypothetical protein VN706_18515 [Gemmatimonadaceae bacterium]|nr:hypothetical protein [Gemmatimonadaceae bacterium]